VAGAIGAIAALRLVGFLSTVAGINWAPALALQYVALLVACALSLLAISRGTVIEPPERLVRAVNALTERLTRRMSAEARA
jgi:hypothetical protein